MAYPGPPGVSSGSHPSLPPRPPPSKLSSGFKPAFSAAPRSAPSYSTSSSAPGYPPSTAAYSNGPSYGPQYGPSAPGASHPYAQQPTSVGAGRGGYGPQAGPPSSYNSYPQKYGSQQGQQGYYGADTGARPSPSSYATPPQIRNPFPVPGGQGSGGDPDHDPEMAAQIAQWQSAYMPRENVDAMGGGNVGAGRGGSTLGPGGIGPAQGGGLPTAQADAINNSGDAAATAAAAAAAAQEKKKTVYREGGGKKWADDSLLEWDPSHLRLFVGNLAGETTDDSLLKAFSRWGSVQRAKVVRDKRTTKSKGYGFVSFSDPDDFFQAAKEMNGKYIQSHPVVVRKSTTEIKATTSRDHHHGKGKNYKKGAGGNKAGNGAGREYEGGGGGGYEPHLGPVGGGISKPGQKTKGGLKLLG